MQLKIDTKLGELAGEALESHVQDLYDNRGSEVVVVATLRAVDRSQPVEDSGIKEYVKVRLEVCEVATPAQAESLRKTQEALYAIRTAEGAVDTDGKIRLHRGTVDALGETVGAAEAARLVVLLRELRSTAIKARQGFRESEAMVALATIEDLITEAVGE